MFTTTERLSSRSPQRDPLRDLFAAFLLDRRAARVSPKTIEAYHYALTPFLAWLSGEGVADVRAITPAHIHAYLVLTQGRGLRDSTQHLIARNIRTWLNWLTCEGLLDVSPMRHVPMPRVARRIPAPFTPDDVNALLDACDRATPIGSRNYALVLALLDSGLRVSECAALTVGDVNARNGVLLILGKGAKQRQAILGARARSALLRMLQWRGPCANTDPLWQGYDVNGKPTRALSPHGIQQALRRLGKRAGVRPCGPHRFRRTFALWMLRDGIDLHSLRLLMGHSDLVVLQRYLALAGEDLERAHAAHSPADKLLGRR